MVEGEDFSHFPLKSFLTDDFPWRSICCFLWGSSGLHLHLHLRHHLLAFNTDSSTASIGLSAFWCRLWHLALTLWPPNTNPMVFCHGSLSLLMQTHKGHCRDFRTFAGAFWSLPCRQIFCTLVHLTLWAAIADHCCKFLCQALNLIQSMCTFWGSFLQPLKFL